jgi:RNA polymerase sigma-70 factor (ECF subfamily)
LSTTHQTKEEIENELQLIRRAQSDPNRFAPLYDKYYKQIFLFIYRRADDQELSADLTSQVFLKAITNLPKYEFKGVPFSAWLYRIASNEVNQHFRKHKSERSVSIEDAGLERLIQEITGIDEETQMKEKILMDGIQQLSQEDLQFIELRFFEDRSFRDIGFILNTTENNAKVKTYRILDKIRKIIGERIKN